MKLYIAGRISNELDYRVKFARACTEVVLLGHTPVNPCELLHDHNKSWEAFMVADLHAMLDCDGVYALRDWRTSKGATIEVQLAMRLGKIITYQDKHLGHGPE